jgi:hypothetical protein
MNRPNSWRAALGLRCTAVIGTGVLVTLVLPTTVASAATKGDSPQGFYYGADGNSPTADGSGPYTEPTVGGSFGVYIAELGTFTNELGCTSGVAQNSKDITAANYERAHPPGTPAPPGTEGYFFMGGPGADPHYTGSTSEAQSWGETEAKYVLSRSLPTFGTKVIFMDIESPGNGEYTGWNERVNSCGQLTGSITIQPSVDRATFNGFFDYVQSKGYKAGVYSSPDFWSETFAGTSSGSIPNTTQWTYEDSSESVSPGPVGFEQSGGLSAQWFGDVNSAHEYMWQWNQTAGDYDQVDANHS